MIDVHDIHASYDKKPVLNGVTLSVKHGEIVALIGPNGAGKSTLLKVIFGLLKPSSGSVLLSGNEMTFAPVHQRVQHGLSYLIQGGEIFTSLTVKENLEIGAMPLPSAERATSFHSVLQLFPTLGGNLNRCAGLLSGGQRKALALAMVLCQRPRVLMLDEPSAGLAPKLVHDVLANVKELNHRWRVSVLLVEQNIIESLTIAHRAVALVNGKIAQETQRPKDWLANGQLKPFFFEKIDAHFSLSTSA